MLYQLEMSGESKHGHDMCSSQFINVSKEWGLHINPLKLVGELSVGEQQRVEIIRCLLQNPKLLIMDEPTSVLSVQETQNLFKVLRNLSDSGCGFGCGKSSGKTTTATTEKATPRSR